jgi:spermidine/putrescine transport system permease protein
VTTATVERRSAPPQEPVRRRRRWVPRYVLALPSYVWYVSYFVVPLGIIVYYSLGYKPASSPTEQRSIGLDRLSLQNYEDTFSDTFVSTFRATISIAVTGTVLLLLVAFPLAYFLATRVSPRWRGLLLGLVIVPFWTSFLLRTFAWRIILAPAGYVSNQLQSLGVIGDQLGLLDTRAAVQLGIVYNYLPLMIFPLFVALERLDPALREASKDLGASRVKTFFSVTLPLAMPGIVAGLLLVFIPLMGEYVTPEILGGARGLMAGKLVVTQFLEAQNWALGSAMAVVLILLTLAIIAVLGLVGVVLRTVLRRRRHVELPA